MPPPSPDAPQPRPFRPLSAMLLAGISYLTVWVVMAIGVAMARGGSVLLFLAASLAVGPLVALYVGLVRYAPHLPTREAVGIVLPRGREWALIALALVVGAGLAPGAFEVMNRLIELAPPPELDPEVEAMMAMPEDTGSVVIILVAVLVVGPLANELLFRGLILGQLRKTRPPFVVFVTVTLLSGMRTAPTEALAGMLVFAAALTALGLWSRSVWPAVIAHVAHIVVFSSLGDPPEGKLAAPPLPWMWIAGATAAALIALIAAWRLGRRPAQG